jgi:hypothetical protein
MGPCWARDCSQPPQRSTSITTGTPARVGPPGPIRSHGGPFRCHAGHRHCRRTPAKLSYMRERAGSVKCLTPARAVATRVGVLSTHACRPFIAACTSRRLGHEIGGQFISPTRFPIEVGTSSDDSLFGTDTTWAFHSVSRSSAHDAHKSTPKIAVIAQSIAGMGELGIGLLLATCACPICGRYS